ncbi:MAG: membrane protein insertase YidC [Acidobacteriota bacterium]
MEKRLLLAAALSLGVLLLWEWIIPKPPRPVPVSTPVPAAATPVSAAAVPAAPSAAPVDAPASASAATVTTLSNGIIEAAVSNRGAVLESLVLKQHFDDQKKPLELVRALPAELPRPLGLDFGKDKELTRRVADALFVVERESDRVLRFHYADPTVSVTKEIRLMAGYLFDVKVTVAGPPYSLLVGPGLRNPTQVERTSRYVMPGSAVALTVDGLKIVGPDKAAAAQEWSLPIRGFAGIEDNYFLEVLAPKTPATARVLSFSIPRPEGKPAVEIATAVAAQGTLECVAFFGPKDIAVLKSTGLGLEKTVDFGWFGILAPPLLFLLKKAYGWVGNWGLAILVVTFLVRAALFPLTAKSYLSMKKMQKLTPKMNAIRDKYKKAKTDSAQRQKMNTELMALYQSEGHNPMSGCLPVLLQLPILFAFYNVLSRTIELRHAPFFLWIRDLSAIDGSYVLVILMTVSMYVQQAMTPAAMDPAQKKVFMFMPIMMGFFMKDMPSGLALYWLFSNLLTILQQLAMSRLVKEDPAPPSGKGTKAFKQARA